MDFVSQAVTLKNFGHLKARVTDYNALDEMYTAQVYGWRLAGGNIVRVFAKEGGLLLIKPCATIGQEVTLVLGGLKGLVKDFRPLEGMYCVEVLAKKSGNQSVGSTVVYCKEAFNDEKTMTLRIKIPKEPVSILNQNALHTMHTLKNFSRT